MSRDGKLETYTSYYLLLKFVKKEVYKSYSYFKFSNKSIGNNWNDSYLNYYIDSLFRVEKSLIKYIVYDEDFRVINIEYLLKDVENIKDFYEENTNQYFDKWQIYWRILKKHGYEYRKDPIPGIHKRKNHRGSWMRTGFCMNEKRAYDKEFTRAKRKPKNLPDAWNDYPRADTLNKHSWKKQKKEKQWM
jgi:hypothetical protein